MTKNTSSEFDHSYTTYQINRGYIRKYIRKFYLRRAASYCKGRVLDFGCGVGELFQFLLSGSSGLEINPHTVKYCQDQGLPVNVYDVDDDMYELKTIQYGQYETLLISHVLEHLTEPDVVLRVLINSCRRVGIRRVVIIVPGAAGYAWDKTHKTFIDIEYLKKKEIFAIPEVTTTTSVYFPVNWRYLGQLFKYHELTVVFDLRN